MSGQPAQLSPVLALVLGIVFIGAGLFIALFALGIIPDGAPSPDTPRWVAACAGLAFALGGAAVIVGFAVAGGAGADGDLPPGTPWGLRLTQYSLGLAITACLAAIASWVAFVPGPRAFTVAGSFIGKGRASEIVGRSAFGVGALLTYVFFIVFAVLSVRRLRRGK